MKHSAVALTLLFLSGAIAQLHKEHRHLHQMHHEKRDVSWTTTWEIVTETLSITTTIWVDGDATSVPDTTTTTSDVHSTSTSSTQTPAEFHQSSTSSTVTSTTSISVAPATPPAPSSSSSVYIAPAEATSTYVAPAAPPTTSVYVAPADPTTAAVYVAPVESVSIPVTTPVYVAPTTSQAPYVAPDPTTAAPVVATTAAASSSGGSDSVCSSGKPCGGDITYYQAGLGACGITSDGDNEMVIALPHALMGTQSNGNPYCGMTVTIEKDGVSIIATVVDKCMGCDGFSIDLSNKAFSSLGVAFAVGRTQASWYFN